MFFARLALSLSAEIREMEQSDTIHIDVRSAIEQKIPRYAKHIPQFVYRKIAKIIRQDTLNRILDENSGKTGVDFAEGALRSLQIGLDVEGEEHIPNEGRFIFVSNHPLGGLDGIALIALLGRRYGGNVKCIVNDILMAVKPLGENFLPINKHGSQTRESARLVEEAYKSDVQMITFPAGLCSRRNNRGEVRDREWKKSFVAKSVETGRDVIPIYFGGLNSDFFYKFAKFRERTGLRLNIEMVCLPGEMVKKAGSLFSIRIGKPIPHSTFDNSRTYGEWAEYVKNIVYSLA